jgi:hypothetical protein
MEPSRERGEAARNGAAASQRGRGIEADVMSPEGRSGTFSDLSSYLSGGTPSRRAASAGAAAPAVPQRKVLEEMVARADAAEIRRVSAMLKRQVQRLNDSSDDDAPTATARPQGRDWGSSSQQALEKPPKEHVPESEPDPKTLATPTSSAQMAPPQAAGPTPNVTEPNAVPADSRAATRERLLRRARERVEARKRQAAATPPTPPPPPSATVVGTVVRPEPTPPQPPVQRSVSTPAIRRTVAAVPVAPEQRQAPSSWGTSAAMVPVAAAVAPPPTPTLRPWAQLPERSPVVPAPSYAQQALRAPTIRAAPREAPRAALAVQRPLRATTTSAANFGVDHASAMRSAFVSSTAHASSVCFFPAPSRRGDLDRLPRLPFGTVVVTDAALRQPTATKAAAPAVDNEHDLEAHRQAVAEAVTGSAQQPGSAGRLIEAAALVCSACATYDTPCELAAFSTEVAVVRLRAVDGVRSLVVSCAAASCTLDVMREAFASADDTWTHGSNTAASRAPRVAPWLAGWVDVSDATAFDGLHAQVMGVHAISLDAVRLAHSNRRGASRRRRAKRPGPSAPSGDLRSHACTDDEDAASSAADDASYATDDSDCATSASTAIPADVDDALHYYCDSLRAAAAQSDASHGSHPLAPWMPRADGKGADTCIVEPFVWRRTLIHGRVPPRSQQGGIARLLMREMRPSTVEFASPSGQGPAVVFALTDLASDVVPGLNGGVGGANGFAGRSWGAAGLVADARTCAALRLRPDDETSNVSVANTLHGGARRNGGDMAVLQQTTRAGLDAGASRGWAVVFSAALGDVVADLVAKGEDATADSVVAAVVQVAARWGYAAPSVLVVPHASPLVADAALRRAKAAPAASVVHADTISAVASIRRRQQRGSQLPPPQQQQQRRAKERSIDYDTTLD